jgi:ADP-heptose:LPS heptosyltransferase
LANTSARELAEQILAACLEDGTWPGRTLDGLIERALDENEVVAMFATRALFGILIERLGDLFEPTLCDVYARLFSTVISRAMPAYSTDALLLRYRQIRQVRRFTGGEVRRVFVLSRVTLGADVAVTSVALAAAKERFPEAEIYLVGPEKNAELFAADPRINPLPVAYVRSSLLVDRLAAAIELKTLVDEPSTIVIDPDSRLTQLGLIPVCDDARYFFFESRAFGGELDAGLPELTAQWMAEVFDVEGMRPYVAPPRQEPIGEITVSFGVGGNADKRLGEEFEYRVLSELVALKRPILLDRGAGGEEAATADALVKRLGAPDWLHVHDGSYASFASHIIQSRLYVGYDSVGQHVAAAAGIPLVTVFAGYACERMLSRWRPRGPNVYVITGDDATRDSALEQTLAAIPQAFAAKREDRQ